MPKAARGFWPMRDVPVVLWLAASGVLALLPPIGTAPRWLMIHLLLLNAGAVLVVAGVPGGLWAVTAAGR